MPIKKAAKKALRQSKKRYLQNKEVKEGIAYWRRRLKRALEEKDKEKLKKIGQILTKLLDKAAKKRLFKKNKSARLKSRMWKKINKVISL